MVRWERDQGSESAAQVSADSVIDHHDRDEEAGLGNTIERSAAGMQRVGDGKTETLSDAHNYKCITCERNSLAVESG